MHSSFMGVLRAEATSLLQSVGQRGTYTRGDLVSEGLPGSGYILIVEEGQLDLYAIQAATGKRLFITTFGPGEVFGDFALLGSNSSEMGNLVLEVRRSTTKLLYLPKEVFFQALDAHKEALVVLISDLATKLSALLVRASSLGLLSVKARLINELINMSRQQGLEGEKVFSIRLQTTHDELADALGTTRQSITRAFASLKKSGCVTTDNEGLTVIDKECARCLDNDCYHSLF